MKRHILSVPLVGICCFCLTSCDTVKSVYQASTSGFNLSATHANGVVNDDQLVVRSEQLLVISLDTFDTFLKIERANRTILDKVSPEIHTFAETVRRNGKSWIKSLEVAHDAYKNNRSSENHATLLTAFKTVQAAVAESQKYITKHGGV
jgi:uncharacterized protein (DUF1501 family)